MAQLENGGSYTAQPNKQNLVDSRYVAGVDIGGTNLRLALADIHGNVLAKWSSSIVGIAAVDAVLDRLDCGLRDLLHETGLEQRDLKSIAVGAPGITDVDEGVVIATSYLLGWRGVPLRTLLQDRLHIPAAVDNDVNLAAIGERWAGAAKGAEDFVFLAIGTGIGAGIVLHGQPFRGHAWAAGEIGYMLVPGTQDAPGDHGNPGGLESLIGGEGIRSQWSHIWRADLTNLPRDLKATQVFDQALAGDALAQKILSQTSHMLALAIYNISSVLNCPLFVLGGGVGLHPALSAATEKKLEQWNMRNQPRLVLSQLGSDAQLMGALSLALDLVKHHITV